MKFHFFKDDNLFLLFSLYIRCILDFYNWLHCHWLILFGNADWYLNLYGNLGPNVGEADCFTNRWAFAPLRELPKIEQCLHDLAYFVVVSGSVQSLEIVVNENNAVDESHPVHPSTLDTGRLAAEM